jgi:hypothetical protein
MTAKDSPANRHNRPLIFLRSSGQKRNKASGIYPHFDALTSTVLPAGTVSSAHVMAWPK